MSLALSAYRAAMALLEPAAPLILKGRAKRGKEDTARMSERLGLAGQPRPEGKLVWLHGVSVGESMSLLPLAARIREERPDLHILMTTGTVTSAELMARRLPEGVIHQFIPVDGPRAVARFLDHWRPNLGVFAESEIWPNLVLAAEARGVKLILASARLTEATAARWTAWGAAGRKLIAGFDLILPQEDESAARFGTFGASLGPQLNLKLVGDPLPHDEAALKALRKQAGKRPVVVAASTHPGEDVFVVEAAPAGALLVIAPRHPDRGAALKSELEAMGRKVALRSLDEPVSTAVDTYVADTLGELGLFLRLADVVVLCGSLIEGVGGHNPLEPARLGAVTISGPYVHKNAALFEAMVGAGAIVIAQPEALRVAVQGLLSDKAARSALGERALAFAGAQSAQFEAGWAQIKARLP